MNKGLGVMIGMLGGNAETVEAHNEAIGKTIASVDMEGDALAIRFDDGTGIRLWDDGQSCCEYRYMVCDDDLTAFTGAVFNGAAVRDGPSEDGEYGEVHEVQFLLVSTSKGEFTVATHNEHNGYYGGFWIVVRPIPSSEIGVSR